MKIADGGCQRAVIREMSVQRPRVLILGLTRGCFVDRSSEKALRRAVDKWLSLREIEIDGPPPVAGKTK